MYRVSAQGVDERMINVHYYYYYMYSTVKKITEFVNFNDTETAQHHLRTRMKR